MDIRFAGGRNNIYVITDTFCFFSDIDNIEAINMAFGNYTYLVYIAVFSWLPVLLLLIRYKKYVKKHLSTIVKAFLITFPIVTVWDAISIYNKAWQYSTDRVINIYIFIMPVEEILMLLSSTLGISIITILFYEYFRKKNIIK